MTDFKRHSGKRNEGIEGERRMICKPINTSLTNKYTYI
jgi:hypothetical protein